MTKEELLNYLKEQNIWYELTKHKPAHTMEDLLGEHLPYPTGCAKNIFVRDDKKKNYYVITIKGNKKVNLKKFKEENNTRHLSFSSPQDLFTILKLHSGEVTPLGILNDKDKKVIFYLDNDFKEEDIIGVHPFTNTETMWLKVKDLLTIIKTHGNETNLTKI